MTTANPHRWLDLREPGCDDRLVVGAKVASLARAAALGFPVPESVIVPCSLSAPVLAAALARADARGPHAGRLEIMAADPVEAGLVGLPDAVEFLGPALAVRSSSPAEDTPSLAGAFSSLMGVAPAEVTTAVLAVWASAIMTRPDADDPGISSMGVLIQPELAPDFAGSAEVLADGSISVVAIDGPAGPLMAGWAAGLTATIDGSGQLSADPRLDEALVLAVADLARRVHAAIGDNLIEWAWEVGRLWLVQARRADRAPAVTADRAEAAPQSGHPERLLRATAWPGELAERWLLPWALADDSPRWPGEAITGPLQVEIPAEESGRDPLELWDEFTAISDELIAQVWRDRPQAAADLARAAATVLRQGAQPSALAEPDPVLADRCLALAAELITHLRRWRIVAGPAEFWALPADLDAVLEGRLAVIGAGRRAQLAALRWEPARYSAIQSCGDRLDGTGVAGGTGCGPCMAADETAKRAAADAGGLPPRPVIVAAYPLPQYAPLLMDAAGLVTRHGSEAAHLITVARSLGVPAVIGPWLLDRADERTPSYAAVDGTMGTVHVFRSDHAFYKVPD
jgi:phosphohistidine swiveling domain-containing protein